MNHLVSVRTNILYSKSKSEKKEEEYKQFHELIFLVDKPAYSMTNDGQIVRQRLIEEQRFFVSDEAFDEMMKILSGIRNADPSELTP